MQTEDSICMEAKRYKKLVAAHLEKQKDLVCGINTKLLDFNLNTTASVEGETPKVNEGSAKKALK